MPLKPTYCQFVEFAVLSFFYVGMRGVSISCIMHSEGVSQCKTKQLYRLNQFL